MTKVRTKSEPTMGPTSLYISLDRAWMGRRPPRDQMPKSRSLDLPRHDRPAEKSRAAPWQMASRTEARASDALGTTQPTKQPELFLLGNLPDLYTLFISSLAIDEIDRERTTSCFAPNLYT